MFVDTQNERQHIQRLLPYFSPGFLSTTKINININNKMTIFVKYIQNKYLNAQVDLEKITVENEALLMYFQMLLDA